MSAETVTRQRGESAVAPPPPEAAAKDAPAAREDALHERARKRVERMHWVKANIAGFLVGMIVLIPVWLLVEWQSAGGFQRWSDGGRPGDWDPWVLWIAIPWFLWMVFVVLGAYFDRNKEEDVEREFARLKSLR